VLYNVLFTYDWSSLYNEISVDAAVTQAIDLAVPSGYIKKYKYPAWFSGKLQTYIKKTFIDVTRSIRQAVSITFFF
jgi:hypothetical protein